MRFLFFFGIGFLLSCHSSTKKSIDLKKDSANKDTSLHTTYPFSDTVLQNKIIDTLIKLSILKRTNKYIDSFSNHKHGLAFLMDTLSKGDTDIFIQAGYNGEKRFETYYQIYVNPNTMGIKFYDPVDDKKLSIKEFEKLEYRK